MGGNINVFRNLYWFCRCIYNQWSYSETIGRLQTGQRRPGTISGILGVLLTPSIAILVFFYTQIISAFGYDGASKVQDVTAQLGIRLATGLLPAVLILIGMFFFSKYPIDKQTEDWVEAEMITMHRSPTEPSDNCN